MRAELVSCFRDFLGRPTVSVLPIPRGERLWFVVDDLPACPLGSILDLDLLGSDRAAIRSADLPRSGPSTRPRRRNRRDHPGARDRVGPPARPGLTEILYQRGFFPAQSGDFAPIHDEDA